VRSPGLVVTAFGIFLGWMALEHQRELLPVALMVVGSGAWIGFAHRIVRGRDRALSVSGGLLCGWALVGGTACVRDALWIGAALCAALVYTGLLLLGALPSPGWVLKAVAFLRRFGLGLVFMGAGLFIVGLGLAGQASEGVPALVLVAAGVTFFLGGVLACQAARGAGDTLAMRTLVALLITAFAAVAVVFPFSLLFMIPLGVLAWIAVARLAATTLGWRDPLAGWSDERQLGLGCGISVVLVLLVVGVAQLRACARQPEGRLPAEAEEPKR
jgi:hypothetical protein